LEIKNRSSKIRFCMGPYGNAIYKDRQEKSISGVG